MAADSLGTRIKRARERKRWTQQELADRVGVNRKTVDNWENERAIPRSSIGALEHVLGEDFNGPPPDPEEEKIRDLGTDRGGWMDPARVGELVAEYRRRKEQGPGDGTIPRSG